MEYSFILSYFVQEHNLWQNFYENRMRTGLILGRKRIIIGYIARQKPQYPSAKKN